MNTTPHGWTILDADAGVLTYSYVFDPKNGAQANAMVARMPNGKLLVFSPPTFDDRGVVEDLAEFGEVGAIATNNGFHHLGLRGWKALHPDVPVFAPTEAIARIGKKSHGAPELTPVSELIATLGDDVSITELPNTKCGESWMRAKIAGGHAWYASDILANMPSLPSNFFVKQMFKWTDSAPGFKTFNMAMKFIVKDRAAVLAQMREEMEAAPPTVVVPGHGGLLTHETVYADAKALLV